MRTFSSWREIDALQKINFVWRKKIDLIYFRKNQLPNDGDKIGKTVLPFLNAFLENQAQIYLLKSIQTVIS